MEIKLPMPHDILVIDDDREFFFDAVYARTWCEGLERLVDKDWELVLWDHDLGGESTIRPVLKILERISRELRPVIRRSLVITDNPVGGEWIMKSLNGMGYLSVVRVDSSPWIKRHL